MTSEGAMGWRARGFIALRIIRWNPRRASISDNGGWSVGGGMDVRGGGSGGGGPGSWKSCQAR